MPLAAGTRLGPYEITALIGAGGMGEVYKARDTRVGRDVAVKISSQRFSERFEREAKVIAQLNHPNICTLFDVGASESGMAYLVMELVEGLTLADRIREGPIPHEETMGIARQIALALEHAHEKPVVHRDLKPANIKIKPDGTVKVLDFGLAKLPARAPSSHPPGAAAEGDASPTLTIGMTEAGVILGTAAYMAPEQARGKPVDKRADIWAFAVVLFEMLTGRRLFKGEDMSHTLAAVIMEEPKLDGLPPGVQRLLRACLEKDPAKRLRDIGDVWRQMEEPPAVAPPAPAARGYARFVWPGVSAILAIAAVAVSVVHFREMPPQPQAPVRFEVPEPAGAELGPLLNLSPNGRKIAFVSAGRLWVHSLETGEARNLTATNGSPFWSPDSRYVAFPADQKLKRIEATGGIAETICDLGGPGWGAGAWGPNGVILFSQGGGRSGSLWRVAATGGTPAPVTKLDSREMTHWGPWFLPDGIHFFYRSDKSLQERDGVYIGSLDLPPERQSKERVVATAWQPVYAPGPDPRYGHLLFIREGTIMAQPFDAAKLKLYGDAVQIAGPVDDNANGAGYAAYAASTNGVLVFWRQNSADARQLTWLDRQGKKLGTVGERAGYFQVALSPDATQAAVVRGTRGRQDIWLVDLTRGGASSRFTFGRQAQNAFPVWSPDGSRIVFAARGGGRAGVRPLFVKPSNGASEEQPLFKSYDGSTPAFSWSRDGRFLLVGYGTEKTRGDLHLLALEGDGKSVPLVATEFNERQGAFSPDGHWIAYESQESGVSEIYVRSFRAPSGGGAPTVGGKWLVSNGGARGEPKWRADGKELYYLSRDFKVMAVETTTSPAFRAGVPQALFQLPDGPATSWDVAGDGKRFLAALPEDAEGPPPYTVIMNWQSLLQGRAR